MCGADVLLFGLVEGELDDNIDWLQVRSALTSGHEGRRGKQFGVLYKRHDNTRSKERIEPCAAH